jgi:hypothetical protein
MRSQDALAMAAPAETTDAYQDKYIVIERAAWENIIFATANFRANYISDTAMSRYKRYIREFMQWERVNYGTRLVFNALLWAVEGETTSRMIKRGDISEQAYVDDYMEQVAHCYFRGVLESILIHMDEEPDKIHPTFRPFVVIDWNKYGNWASIQKLLDQGRVQFEYQGRLRAPVNGVTESPPVEAEKKSESPETKLKPDSVTSLKDSSINILSHSTDSTGSNSSEPERNIPVISFIIEKEVTQPHPVWTDNGHILHLNMAWYEGLSIANHKQQRSSFRDQFFKALVEGKAVVFHTIEGNPMAQRNTRQVYTADYFQDPATDKK